jgi:hypothetical protein
VVSSHRRSSSLLRSSTFLSTTPASSTASKARAPYSGSRCSLSCGYTRRNYCALSLDASKFLDEQLNYGTIARRLTRRLLARKHGCSYSRQSLTAKCIVERSHDEEARRPLRGYQSYVLSFGRTRLTTSECNMSCLSESETRCLFLC